MGLKALCLVLVTVLAVFKGVAAHALVGGPCSNCHTMHNMQNGASVIPGGEGPYAALTKDNCVGCHSNSGTETIVDLGGGTHIPIVWNTTAPTYPPDGSASSVLAGGNFHWVVANGDAYGHNVFGISAADSVLDRAPGTSTTGCIRCHDTLAMPTAGCKGCHVPKHHADDSAEVVETSGGWYRFLGENPAMLGSPDVYGIKGIEEDNWEQNPAPNRHNGYFGTSQVYNKDVWPYLPTFSIGQFCVGCHGNFHHGMNTDQPAGVAGAWIRHPSDVVIPNSGEYAPYIIYNPLAPVAKTDLTGKKNSIEVVPGSDVVTCISCHRPHGSPFPDMLRWDYATCISGTSDPECGCFVCHTAKDE